MNTYYASERQKHRYLKVWCVCILKAIVKYGRHFCEETSIHGFSQIAAERRHWTERLLWVCVTGLAAWGAMDLSMGQLHRYNENPTVVTLEKDYRTWRFNLPAVTACYSDRLDGKKLPSVIMKYWNTTPSDGRYEYYARFVDAVVNSDVFHLSRFQEFRDDEELHVDMFQLALDATYTIGVHNNLKTMTSETGNVGWATVMTEVGVCYVTNTVAADDVAVIKFNPNATRLFPVTCIYSRNCYIKIDITSSFIFHVHSPYDLPDMAQISYEVTLAEHHTTELSVMETRCEKGVRDIRPKRRGCRYTDEPSDTWRQVYSTNTCRISCRSRLAKQLCGCVPFYYFYEGGPQCNAAGLFCLASHSHRLGSNAGVQCACPPQCLDSVYREISATVQRMSREPFSNSGSLKLLVQPPRTRYTREIVFHFQDLVVSFGGAAGLFLGASFISFAEILYFILVKIFKCSSQRSPPEMGDRGPVLTYEMMRILHYTSVLKKMKSLKVLIQYDNTQRFQ